MKRNLAIALLLALSLVFSLGASALADDGSDNESIIENLSIETNDESIMPLRYSLIKSISASLVIDNNIAYCTGRVTTQEVVASIKITMTLQKYSGGDWITYAQWSQTKYNTRDFMLQRNTPVDSGSYRLYVEATVTAYGGEEEEATAITNTEYN